MVEMDAIQAAMEGKTVMDQGRAETSGLNKANRKK